MQTDYVFAAVLRSDFIEAQRRLEVKKNPILQTLHDPIPSPVKLHPLEMGPFCLQTDYVFAAVLRPDFIEAQRRLEVKKPGAVHDVLATAWLREMDAAGEPIGIM